MSGRASASCWDRVLGNYNRRRLGVGPSRSPSLRHSRDAQLRRHFSDWEIAEITWLNALENYYNLINVPLEIESDGFCAIAQARTA